MMFNLKTASFGAASALVVLLFADVPARATLSDTNLTPHDEAVLVSARSGKALTVQGTQENVNENLLQPVALMATLFNPSLLIFRASWGRPLVDTVTSYEHRNGKRHDVQCESPRAELQDCAQIGDLLQVRHCPRPRSSRFQHRLQRFCLCFRLRHSAEFGTHKALAHAERVLLCYAAAAALP